MSDFSNNYSTVARSILRPKDFLFVSQLSPLIMIKMICTSEAKAGILHKKLT